MKQYFNWKQETGKTLTEWAKLYGVTKEGARKRYLASKAFKPLANDRKSGVEYSNTVYNRWQGAKLQTLAKQYGVSDRFIIHWHQTQPNMTFEEFTKWRNEYTPKSQKGKSNNQGKWSPYIGSTRDMPNINGD